MSKNSPRNIIKCTLRFILKSSSFENLSGRDLSSKQAVPEPLIENFESRSTSRLLTTTVTGRFFRDLKIVIQLENLPAIKKLRNLKFILKCGLGFYFLLVQEKINFWLNSPKTI